MIDVAGKKIALSCKLPEENRQKLIPAETVLKAVGATLKVSGNRLEAAKDGRTAIFTGGSRKATINQVEVDLAAAPRQIDGEWYITANAIAGFLRLYCLTESTGDSIIMFKPVPNTVWIEDISGIATAENSPFDAIDGDTTTYWAAQDSGAWLKLTLGNARISGLGISWYNGAQRKYQFEILTSTDGKE